MSGTTPESFVKQVTSKSPDGVHETALTSWSKRISKKQVAVIFCVIGVGGTLLCVRGGNSLSKKETPTASMKQAIPENEIKPAFLAQLGNQENDRTAQAAQKKNDDAKKDSVIPISSGGSMAIFLSNDASSLGSLGIPMGTQLEAVLEQSGSGPTPIVAKVAQDFIKDERIKIPKSSRLFGVIQGSNDRQFNVRFTRMVYPTGEDFPFSGIASVNGSVSRKHSSRGISILSGAAIGSAGVFVPGGAGFADNFLRNVYSGGANEVSHDLNAYGNSGTAPSVKIKANQRITIMVDRPL